MTNIKLLTASLELIENEFFNTLTVSAVIWKNDENKSKAIFWTLYTVQ